MEGCTRFSKLATYLPTENGEGAPFSRRAGEGDETFQPAETGAFIPYFWSQSAQTRQFFHALPRAHGAVPKFIPVQGYTGPPLSAFMSTGCTMTSVVRSKCLGRSSEDITMHYLPSVGKEKFTKTSFERSVCAKSYFGHELLKGPSAFSITEPF